MTGASRPVAVFATLGCKVNQYDTASMMALMQRRGYDAVAVAESDEGRRVEQVADPRRVRVCVVNTCTVTATADAKGRKLARRIARAFPGSVLVVAGCYAQLHPELAAALPGVDVVMGTANRGALPDLVEQHLRTGTRVVAVGPAAEPPGGGAPPFEELPTLGQPGRIRALVKVQEGCNSQCAYCAVPAARGPERSRAPEAVLAEVRALVEAGYPEIVLTGIHLARYGSERWNIARLLAAVAEIPGRFRIRLSSVEPGDVTEDLLSVMARHASGKVCRHLHVPLQSGDDRILRLMNRPYSAAACGDLVATARRKVPGLAVTTDVIVGFPGETDEEFERSLSLVSDIGFSRVHVFRYSPRPGTPAALMAGQVPEKTRAERSERMIAQASCMSRLFHEAMVGREWTVLVERTRRGRDGAMAEGLTDTYVRVRSRTTETVLEGTFTRAAVERASAEGVTGRLVGLACETGLV